MSEHSTENADSKAISGSRSIRGDFTGWIIDGLILLAMFTAFFLLQVYWLSLDPLIPGGDASMLLTMSLKFKRMLFESGAFSASMFNTAEYPPLPFWISTIMYRVFGESEYIAYLGVSLTVMLAIAGLYLGGRKAGGRAAGLLSALLLLSCPEFLYESRSFLPDVPMMGFLALAVAALLYSDYFRKKSWAAAFGILFGLGMLAKFSLFYFIAGAVIIMLPGIMGKEKRGLKIAVMAVIAGLIVIISWVFKSGDASLFVRRFISAIWPVFIVLSVLISYFLMRSKKGSSGDSFNNFIGAFVLSAGIFVPWYLGAAPEFFEKARIHFFGWYSTQGASFLEVFKTNLASLNSFIPLGFVLPAAGFVYSLFFKSLRRFALIFAGAFVFAFFLTSWSVGYNPFPRYVLPLIIYMILFIALGFGALPRAGRVIAGIIIMILGLWGMCGWVGVYNYDIQAFRIPVLTAMRPQPESFGHRDTINRVLSRVIEDSKARSIGKPPVVLVAGFSELYLPDFGSLSYYGEKARTPVVTTGDPGVRFRDFRDLVSSDYALFYQKDFPVIESISGTARNKYGLSVILLGEYNLPRAGNRYKIRLYRVSKSGEEVEKRSR
ncbi:MAG: glycosyltransferase family 39 protein [Chloroflexi bacterium]|nr:glycosyltransferase family 39 protein [Chloroflexota bacterium]